MTIFGGSFGTGQCGNDVWVLTNANGTGGTPAWIQLAPTGTLPTPRRLMQAAYDSITNRMIVFGGEQCSPSLTDLNDIWVLTNANGLGGIPSWFQLSPTPGTSPIPREDYAAAYDGSTNRLMILFGALGFSTLSDAWVLTNANGQGVSSWINLVPAGTSPGPREGASAIYDPLSNRLTIYGGTTSCPSSFGPCTYPDDTWMLQNANGLSGLPTWTKLNPVNLGTVPPARRSHTAVYDPGTNRMIIFGGDQVPSIPAFNDTWILTNPNGLLGSVLQVSPNLGGNVGSATVLIIGSGFVPGTQVTLVSSGQPSIAADNIQIIGPGTLEASFDLIGDTPGIYDLVVMNSEGASFTLPAAFTVQQGGGASLWVDLIGPAMLRAGVNQTYYVVYGNRGSIDATQFGIWLRLPAPLIFAAFGGQTPSSISTVGTDTLVYFELASVVPVSSSGAIPLTLSVPDDPRYAHQNFQIQVWTAQ